MSKTYHLTTPLSDETPGYLARASVVENIIHDDMLNVKSERSATDMIILFVIGAICAFVLPQVNLTYRFVILVLGLVVLGNANYFMVSSFRIVPQTVYIMLELIMFSLAAPFLDSILIKQASSGGSEVPKPKKPVKVRKEQADVPKANGASAPISQRR